MRRWTEGEITVLIQDGPHVPDSQIAKTLGRTTDAVKSKKSELGILKIDMSRYQRIPIEPEQPQAPGLTEADWVGSDNSGIDPETERNRVLFMFLSRLDEFDMETLILIEGAVDSARRGLQLLNRDPVGLAWE